jgi:hypothetical protein
MEGALRRQSEGGPTRLQGVRLTGLCNYSGSARWEPTLNLILPSPINRGEPSLNPVNSRTSSQSEGVQFLTSPLVQFSMSPDRGGGLGALNIIPGYGEEASYEAHG